MAANDSACTWVTSRRMQAAEEMLTVVREVYPSAWAGEAPGKKLRASSPAAAAPAPPPPRRCRTAQSAPSRPPLRLARAAAAARARPLPSRLRAAAPQPAPAPEPHPFAATPPPAPKPEFEEPFVLAEDDTDFKPLDVPVVHPPARAGS